ncbi:MAG: SET domain-containing protein [Bacteroidia bacterium]|nr:SET domain-containing protein [Bacteroidia bacterium]
MALIVKKSKIPNAGKGLFTTKAIAKGEKVIEYRGEIIEWKAYAQRVKDNKDGYLFFLSRNHCIDAWSTPQYKARYANDAIGFTRVKGMRNNSQYEVEGKKAYIVTTRALKAGEEIYVDYTREYWVKLRYNVRLEAAKKKEKEEAAVRKKKKAEARARKAEAKKRIADLRKKKRIEKRKKNLAKKKKK